MTSLPYRLVLGLALLLIGSAGQAAPPTQAEIDQAIKDLADNRFPVREKASAFLRAAGRAAEPALLKTLANQPTLEMRQRLERILEEFKWGIYPDTPKDVLAQIKAYRTSFGTFAVRLASSFQLPCSRRMTDGRYLSLAFSAAPSAAGRSPLAR